MKAGSALSPEVERRIRGRIGTTLCDQYRLDHLLGIGRMASVFAATRRNGSRVALKVLHPELSKTKEVRARFLREGYAANRVGHAGAVRVHDDGDDGAGSAFIVMELLEGETLEARWELAGKKLPLDDVLGWADRLLDILASAHERGIVHEDIEPKNLFLARDGGFKVLDFGIARLLDLTGATRSGEPAEPRAFMAPELACGKTSEIDARTDLWSVGATIFTLLAGLHVHDAPNVGQAVHAAGASARSLATVASEVPAAVVSLVDTALAFEQDGRWQTAKAMRAALHKVQAASPAALAARAALGDADTLPPPPVREARESADATSARGAALLDARPRKRPR